MLHLLLPGKAVRYGIISSDEIGSSRKTMVSFNVGGYLSTFVLTKPYDYEETVCTRKSVYPGKPILPSPTPPMY